MTVDPDDALAYELTEEQARRWAKHELGEALGEIKHNIDDKLATWRQHLDDFNRSPITPDTKVTPDAARALFDFFKQLPTVVGQSVSGDEERIAAARDAMAKLQEQLKRTGIDVDDRIKNFPERLSELRKNAAKPRR